MGYGDLGRPADDELRSGSGDHGRTAASTDHPRETRQPTQERNEAGGDPALPQRARQRGSELLPVLLALLVGLALGVSGSLLLDDDGESGAADPFAGHIDTGSYQAVILANDRVYFGQIRSANDEFYRLENAFFLQEGRADDAAEPVRALLPVSREIHGPKSEMLIAKSEVVLVEDLAEDSPVLREIERQRDRGSEGGG